MADYSEYKKDRDYGKWKRLRHGYVVSKFPCGGDGYYTMHLEKIDTVTREDGHVDCKVNYKITYTNIYGNTVELINGQDITDKCKPISTIARYLDLELRTIILRDEASIGDFSDKEIMAMNNQVGEHVRCITWNGEVRTIVS